MEEQIGRIPTERILEKADGFFNKNNPEEAGRLLEYWKQEAENLRDYRGEVTVVSELIGYYRKNGNREKCFVNIQKALELIDALALDGTACATVYLNIATGLKAFGESQAALDYYTKTDNIYRTALPENHRLFAGLYNNRALAYEDLFMYDSAKKDYSRAIAIMSQYDDGKPDEAISYINLAHLYDKMNNRPMAHRCMNTAYRLLTDNTVIQNGYFAYVLSKCAPSFAYFDMQDRADAFHRLSEKIYEGN